MFLCYEEPWSLTCPCVCLSVCLSVVLSNYQSEYHSEYHSDCHSDCHGNYSSIIRMSHRSLSSHSHKCDIHCVTCCCCVLCKQDVTQHKHQLTISWLSVGPNCAKTRLFTCSFIHQTLKLLDLFDLTSKLNSYQMLQVKWYKSNVICDVTQCYDTT